MVNPSSTGAGMVWNTYDTNFKGLTNAGKNNCFLNVVIQSLWHLASFRNEFLTCRHHLHSDRELILRRRRSLLALEKRNSIEMGDDPNEESYTPQEVLAA